MYNFFDDYEIFAYIIYSYFIYKITLLNKNILILIYVFLLGL